MFQGHPKLTTRRILGVALPLAAIAAAGGASAAFGDLGGETYTPAPAPIPGRAPVTFLALTGAKTGRFVGSVIQRGHEGQIQVLALNFGLTSPRDPATGLATGKFICQGVNFRKPTDRSTPQLLTAGASNETLLSAVFTETRANLVGIEQPFMTVKLTNAAISSLHVATATTTGSYDDVTLVPQRVDVTSAEGNVIAAVDCAANRLA